ncbi:MAG: ribonuclease HII [Chitinophagales bacterium]|nr:ribonuclease HII [Chitinophagales bacterium]
MLKPFESNKIVCGVDEAGRGCLAGPVTAAAVILPKEFHHQLLNDSKQVKATNRNQLRKIIEAEAIAYAVCSIDNIIIDEINILQATYKAMHGAIAQLKVTPEILLIDGNRFKPYEKIAHHCIIKGDATYIEIAAASILAKTYRDELMETLHQEYPNYNWQNNKAYPTLEHRRAIKQYGATKYHRQSFQLLKAEQLKFDF